LKKAFAIGAGLLVAHLILRQLRKQQPTINYVDRVPLNFNAVTVPPIGIYINKNQQANAALLKHELVHWQQYQRMGLLNYYLQYAKGHLVNGYDLNPMEIEARANESDYCKANYTSCVRNGTANTVQLKTFRS